MFYRIFMFPILVKGSLFFEETSFCYIFISFYADAAKGTVTAGFGAAPQEKG